MILAETALFIAHFKVPRRLIFLMSISSYKIEAKATHPKKSHSHILILGNMDISRNLDSVLEAYDSIDCFLCKII